MPFKWRSLALLKQILLITAIFLLLYVVPLQSGRPKVGISPSNDQQKIFDITQSALPGHYATLLFESLEGHEWDLLYRKVSAFQLTRAIRQEWDKIKDKKKVVTKVKGSKSVKTAPSSSSSSSGATPTTAVEDAEELKKLVYVELAGYVEDNAVDKPIVERIRQIWVIFLQRSQAKMLQHSDDGKGKNFENNHFGPVVQALHMSTIRSLLADKNANNELIKRFKDFPLKEEKEQKEEAEAKHELFMRAKSRLRSIVGEQAMFEELELQEPLLQRLDLIELKEQERLFMQMFARPMKQPSEQQIQAKIHLEISTLLGHIIYMTRAKHGPEMFAREVQQYWDKKVAKEVRKDNKKMMENILKRMCEWFTIVRDQKNKNNPGSEEYPDVEKVLRLAHARQLQSVYLAEDSQFMQFINENPGFRARVHNFLGADTPEILMHFKSAVLEQLTINYIEAINDAKSELKRLKALVSVDVLVMLHWLDKQLPEEIGKEQWNRFRDMFLLFLDRMVDANSVEVDEYGRYYKSTLMELIDHIRDEQKSELIKSIAQLELLRQAVRKKGFYSDAAMPCTEIQNRWLANEHRNMLHLLLQIQGGSESKARRRLRGLSPEKIEQLAKLLTGGNNQYEMAAIVDVFAEKEGAKGIKEREIRETSEEAAIRKGKANVEEIKEQNDEWEIADVLVKKMAVQYLQAIAEETSTLQRTRAKASVDVLIQLIWEDKFFRTQAAKGIFYADWFRDYRLKIVQFLKQLEVGKGDEEWVEKYAILYGNMFYKMRWLNELEEEHLELGHLLKIESKQLEQFKKYEAEGKHLPVIELAEAKFQKEWLWDAHLNTIKIFLDDLSMEDYKHKFKHEFAVLESASEKLLIVRLSKLMGINRAKTLVEKEILDEKMSPNALLNRGDGNEALVLKQEQLELQEKVFFQCSPNEGRGDHGDTSEYGNDPYLHFMYEKDNVEFWKREADIQMLTWLFMNIVSKLFLEANKELGSELEELAKVRAEWDELLGGMETSRVMETLLKTGVTNMQIRETKEQSLCRYHAFVVKSILENNTLANKFGRQKWTKVLEETGLMGDLVKWLKKLPGLKFDPRCGPEHSVAVVTQLIDHPDRANAHFVFLDMRIRKSEHLRHFFCSSEQPRKDRLLKFVDVKGLTLLEEGHPDVLKIEKIHPKVQFHLYTVYIEHLSDTPLAAEAELRIAVPWLVELLKTAENDQNITTNSELDKAIRERAHKLRVDLFNDKEWGLISKRSVCLMGMFFAFVKSIQDQDKAKGKKSNSEASSTKDALELNMKVMHWNAVEECKNEETKKNILLGQRKKFAQKHQSFIIEHYEQFFNLDELGWRAKVKKLAPDFQFNDYDWESFTSVSRLQRLLHASLCTESEEQFLASLLGIRFIIWANYMDAELEQKPADSVERTFWKKNRKRLLVKLDKQFDQSLDRLTFMDVLLENILTGLTSLLLRKDYKLWAPVERQSSSIQLRWMENTFADILDDKCKLWNKIWEKQGNYDKTYLSWMHGSVRDALLGFLKPGKRKEDEGENKHNFWMNLEEFRAEIKQNILEHPEIKKRLKRLVGTLGVKPVAKELGLKKWKPEEFGLKEEDLKEKKEDKNNKESVASFWPNAPYMLKFSKNKKADDSGSSESSKTFDFPLGANMPSEASGKKQHVKAKKTHLERSSPLESRPPTPVHSESTPSEHHMSEAPSESETSSVMTGEESTGHSKAASPRDKEPIVSKMSSKSLDTTDTLEAKPIEVQESHFWPIDGTEETMEEGEWELSKASKKKLAKMAPSELHGAAGSSIHRKDQRMLHPSAGTKISERKKHGLFKPWGPSPGANLSDYFAVAKPHGVKKKKGDIGEETQTEADIGASKPVEQMSHIDEPARSTIKLTATANERQKTPWATLKPAESQISDSKLAKPLINFGTFPELSAVEETEKEDANPSQLRFGSIDTQKLEFMKQQTPRAIEPEKSLLEQNHNKSTTADVIQENPSKNIHLIEVKDPKIEADQKEGHNVNNQMESCSSVDQRTELEKPVEGIGADEAKEVLMVQTAANELFPPSTLKREEEKAILRPNHAMRMPALTIRTKGSAMVPHRPLFSVRSDSMQQQWMNRAQVEVHSLRELLIEKQALSKANLYEAVENLKNIVQSWSSYSQWEHGSDIIHIKEAILLFTGSYLLQLHTSDSDIDCIVLLPFASDRTGSPDRDWKFLYEQLFFGDEEVEVLCDLEADKRECENWSLYCALCKTPGLSSLHKLKGRDQIPMITMKFQNFDFDLLFVTLPTQLMPFVDWRLPSDYIKSLILSSLPSVDQMIASFINWIDLSKKDDGFSLVQEHVIEMQKQASLPVKDCRKGMLLALSGYRANLLIKNLIARRNPFQMEDSIQLSDSFQLAYLALKLWAKNHFVYGGKFGFLNGTTLTMLLLQVFLKYPSDPAPDLLFHFFDTYSQWQWPYPVKLNEALSQRVIYNSHYYASLDWNPDNEKIDRGKQLWQHYLAEHAKLVWPVVVPGFPTQNAAFNVNDWTKQAMQTEFENGLKQVKASLEAIRAELHPNMLEMRGHWAQWLNGRDFREKYNHYMAIISGAESAELLSEFCDYVEGRIRLQILFDFGDASLFKVKWMHASPEKVRRNVPCPSDGEGQLLPADNNWHCTIWLVGIQLDKDMKQENIEQILKQKLVFEEYVGKDEPWKKVERTRLEDFSYKFFRSFKGKGSVDTSSPHSSTKSSRGSPSSSTDSPPTPGLSPMSKTTSIVDEQSKKKLWTIFLTKEKLHEWLKEIPFKMQN